MFVMHALAAMLFALGWILVSDFEGRELRAVLIRPSHHLAPDLRAVLLTSPMNAPLVLRTPARRSLRFLGPLACLRLRIACAVTLILPARRNTTKRHLQNGTLCI